MRRYGSWVTAFFVAAMLQPATARGMRREHDPLRGKSAANKGVGATPLAAPCGLRNRVHSGAMRSSRKAILLACAFVLCLNACAAATALPPSLTASAAPSATPLPVHTPTAVPSPFPQFMPSPTGAVMQGAPTAMTGPELDCRLNSQYPPDGSKFERRADFTVLWNVTNTGTAAWDPGTVDLVYIGGTVMFLKSPIPLEERVAPGQTVTLRADMKALRNTSSYVTQFALRRGDTYFCVLGVKIFVQSAQEQT